MNPDEGVERTASFGERHEQSVVDRFGVWLSARKMRRYVRSWRGLSVGDFGCGYDATFMRTIVDEVEQVVLVDVSLAPDLLTHRKVIAIEAQLPEAARKVASSSLDVVVCTSVLEHLWDPLEVLQEFHRVARPGATILLNVPTWRGKTFLEFSAFRLGLSPREEMDDHKAYYDPSDLWPLLVRAGFQPSGIRCFTHKFGLNTFAVLRIPG